MITSDRVHTKRVPADATGPPSGDGGFQYADAFETRLPAPDGRSAEEFARSALDHAPAVVRLAMYLTQRYVLGFRLQRKSDRDHIQGWRIVHREPTVVQLEVTGLLGRAVVVGQRPNPTTAVLTTYNFYRRPWVGHALWAVAGPVHRRIAVYLMRRAATAPATRGLADDRLW